jgi:hypothetical protein
VDAPREHGEEQLGEFGAGARVPAREHVGAQQHHRPHLARRQRRPHAGRVAPHEVALQVAQAPRRDGHVRQLAEAGGDAVHHRAARDEAVDDRARLGHVRACRGGERRRRAALGHAAQRGDGERAAVERGGAGRRAAPARGAHCVARIVCRLKGRRTSGCALSAMKNGTPSCRSATRGS